MRLWGLWGVPTLQLPPVSVLEARLDWLSCSAQSEQSSKALWRNAEGWLERESSGGERLREYKTRGYAGLVAGRIRLARSGPSTILALSGELAEEYGEPCAVLADHWSRVDYCVTGVTSRPGFNYARLAHKQALEHRRQRGRGAGITFLDSQPGGSSLYLGRRTASTYSRLYDKAAESKGDYPGGSWRWECELKRHRSEAEQGRWRLGRPDRSEVLAIVEASFTRSDVEVPFTTWLIAKTPHPASHRRDSERIYRWLQEQVAPSAKFLAQVAGVEAVMMALGISLPNGEDT